VPPSVDTALAFCFLSLEEEYVKKQPRAIALFIFSPIQSLDDDD
jgi:hypothetical protein